MVVETIEDLWIRDGSVRRMNLKKNWNLNKKQRERSFELSGLMI